MDNNHRCRPEHREGSHLNEEITRDVQDDVKKVMDEFGLIRHFFQSIPCNRQDVVFGIGDDAACLSVSAGHQLLVSSDTLVADVHFCQNWDAYDIAYKAVMVNVSDIAAMGGTPCWLTLALTLPALDTHWLQRFSEGLRDSLSQFNIALIGGDTTRGPLSMTLTIHGYVPEGKSIRRSGARQGDKVYVTGELGAAALAVAFLTTTDHDPKDMAVLLNKLQHPKPRIDFCPHLQAYATSAIDISDGLSADLNHICVASHVGVCLNLNSIPVHPLLRKYKPVDALDFALTGGDDYELCFTVSPEHETLMLASLTKAGLRCYLIGEIEADTGLWAKMGTGEIVALNACGYQHFS